MIEVVYTHTCDGCDWQPDPRARAGVETQIERHMKATQHSVITRGRPKEDTCPQTDPSN